MSREEKLDLLMKGYIISERFDKNTRQVQITVMKQDFDGLELSQIGTIDTNGYMYEEVHDNILNVTVNAIDKYIDERKHNDVDKCNHSTMFVGNQSIKKKVCTVCRKDMGYSQIQELKVNIGIN